MFERIDITDLLKRNKFKGGMNSVEIPEIRCVECDSVYTIEKGWEKEGSYMMTLWHTTFCSEHPEKEKP